MQGQNVILTGFMGTGKTTVGAMLAERLEYHFVDTDVLIEERAGQSVAEIFAQLGEAPFRRMEHEVAVDLSLQSEQVIATGGRMMLDPENVSVLGKNGRIFCLAATPDIIFSRVTTDAKRMERPLLKGPNPKAKIEALLQERQPQYAQFPQIDTVNQTVEQVVNAILEQLER